MRTATRRLLLGAFTLTLAAVLFAATVATVHAGNRPGGPASTTTLELLISAIVLNAVAIVAWTSAMRVAERDPRRVLTGMVAATAVAAGAFLLLVA